jgi:alkaline phosphatase D
VADPLVQVFNDSDELVYNLRLAGDQFRPHVFAEGRYRVRVADTHSDRERVFPDLVATADNDETIEVML